MKNSRKLTSIVSMGAFALLNCKPGMTAAPPEAAPPEAVQRFSATVELNGWWDFITTVRPEPGVPDPQGLNALPPAREGDSFLSQMVFRFEPKDNRGGSLDGWHYNVPEKDEEKQMSRITGVVRYRNSRVANNKPPESQPESTDTAAAGAAAAKSLPRDVMVVVIVDIPDEDEDIMMRYRGTQLENVIKGAVEFGKRDKEGKFEKGGRDIHSAQEKLMSIHAGNPDD